MRIGLLLLLSATLAGCAGLGTDGGLGPAQQAAQQRRANQDPMRARSDAERERIGERVAELLRAPLTADAAVLVALLNHRGLQASFLDLGLGEAELMQASRLPDPGFTFGKFKAADEREIERGFRFSLARAVALPWLREPAQGALALRVLEQGTAARKAWVQAVAAQESVRYAQQVMRAAEAGAELARRMAQVGNFSPLQRSREQAFYADAALGVARAEQAERSARERLTRAMGLWGTQTAFLLPERLPDLPAQASDRPDVERTALAERLDIRGARLAAQQSAAPTQRGREQGFTLPGFDGGAQATQAEPLQRQALLRAEQAAVDARSEVREAYGAYRSAYDIARHHRDEIVPLRKRILDENVLRYNGMLIGVFELLAEARTQIASVNAAIDALRDFWLAQADLDMALLGKPSPTPMAPAAAPMPDGGAAH